MTMPGRLRGLCAVVVAMVTCVMLASCDGSNGTDATPSSTASSSPPTAAGRCGEFTIAYDPTNGYEASAFIVAAIASNTLGCDVSLVKSSSRTAWQLVARGEADVYLDAYGVPQLRRRLAGADGPVRVVGPNGVPGVVRMLAPFFMGRRGLDTARDLAAVDGIGWGVTTPAITTVPALLPLARAFVEFQNLDYVVRDYNQVGVGKGLRTLMQQPRMDDATNKPNVYLVAGPRGLLGDRPGQHAIDIPESSAGECLPSRASTLCSFGDFRYLKIANADFAESGSPAYALVYNYALDPASAANILELVVLSGYDVGSADVASWLNTHPKVWRRWVP